MNSCLQDNEYKSEMSLDFGACSVIFSAISFPSTPTWAETQTSNSNTSVETVGQQKLYEFSEVPLLWTALVDRYSSWKCTEQSIANNPQVITDNLSNTLKDELGLISGVEKPTTKVPFAGHFEASEKADQILDMWSLHDAWV